MFATLKLRNSNSSVLLVEPCKNCVQLAGSFVLPGTSLCTPTSRYSLIDSLKLSGVYESHTMSTRGDCWSCESTYGMNTRSAYSSNIEEMFVGRLRATPWKTLEWYLTVGSAISSWTRHLSRSLFFCQEGREYQDQTGRVNMPELHGRAHQGHHASRLCIAI